MTIQFSTDNVDYRAPVGNYVFRSGSRRECLDLIILNDLQFELSEDLSGRLIDVLIDGTSAIALPQVTITPEETVITIEDTDGREHYMHLLTVHICMFCLYAYHMYVLY